MIMNFNAWRTTELCMIHSSALGSFEPCGVELWDVFTMDWQCDCFLDKLFSWLNQIEYSTSTNCYFRELSILDRVNTLQEQIVFVGNYLHVFWTVLKLWLMITKPAVHSSLSTYIPDCFTSGLWASLHQYKNTARLFIHQPKASEST